MLSHLRRFAAPRLVRSARLDAPKPRLSLFTPVKYFSTEIDPNATNKQEKWKYFYDAFSKDFMDLSQELERRKYNTRAIVAVLAGIFAYATYGFFRNWASKEVVNISSKTFDDETFKKESIAFAKETIKQLVLSEEVQADLTVLLEKSVVNLINQKNIQNKLTELIVKVVESKEVKVAAKKSTAEMVEDLINSEENEDFRRGISTYLASELQTQLTNEENQIEASKFAKKTIWSVFW